MVDYVTITTILLSVGGIIATIIWATKQLKAQYEIEANRIIKQTELQAEKDLEKQREDLFLKLRTEKLIAILDATAEHSNCLENLSKYSQFLINVITKFNDEKKKNPLNLNPLPESVLEEIIIAIMDLETEPKYYHEYLNDFSKDHSIAVNTLQKAIKIFEKRRVRILEDCYKNRTGWAIFVDNKALVHIINNITNELNTAVSFLQSNNFKEVEERIKKVDSYHEQLIHLARKQILSGAPKIVQEKSKKK